VVICSEPISKKHLSTKVRVNAAQALGKIQDIRAVEPLIAALCTAGVYAAQALGQIRDARAVKPLIDALDTLGASAVEALGHVGDTRAVEHLIVALKSSKRLMVSLEGGC
jgi:HEAT repeat protein